MGRRTLLLVAALVVAVLGTVLVFAYAQNAKNAAVEGQSMVKVLVAKSKIEISTSGATASANGAFEQQDVPQSNVVAGALSDAAPLANLVALVPIFPGQQIIAPQWGAVAQTGGLSIPAGDMAISVTLGDPERVAGFVTPGALVSIFTTGKDASGQPNARMLLDKVQVLAVGAATAASKASGTTSGNTEAIPNTMMTLALTQSQVEKVLLVTKGGATYAGLTFALLAKDSKTDPTSKGATPANLFP